MKIAEAIMDCFATQRMRDEMVVLQYAMDVDFDDGLAGLVENKCAPAHESSHVRCDLPYLRWRPVDPAKDVSSQVVDRLDENRVGGDPSDEFEHLSVF